MGVKFRNYGRGTYKNHYGMLRPERRSRPFVPYESQTLAPMPRYEFTYNRSLINSIFKSALRFYRAQTGRHLLHLPAQDRINFFKKIYFPQGLRFFIRLLSYAQRRCMENWHCPLYALSFWMPFYDDVLGMWVFTSPADVFANINFTSLPLRNVSTFCLNENWIQNFWRVTVCRASKYD